MLKKVSCTIEVFPAFHNFEYKMSPNLYRKIKIMLISSVILIETIRSFITVLSNPPPFFFHQFSEKLNRKYVGCIKDQFKKSHSTLQKNVTLSTSKKNCWPHPKKSSSFSPPSNPPKDYYWAIKWCFSGTIRVFQAIVCSRG